MIPAIDRPGQPGAWRLALQQAVTDPLELLQLLDLEPGSLDVSPAALEEFRMLVPRGFVARMRRGDPQDPLLRQVLPVARELERPPGFVADPVGDLGARIGTGLLHKYHGRALLIATGTCAVNCRYCFRRHFPYESETAARGGFAEALERLRADPSIAEVILSGGDPLVLSDRRLAELAGKLSDFPHLRRLRLHTRLPIVLPERIDDGFMSWWSQLRLDRVVVVHANHANEIDAGVSATLQRLREDGSTVLNQSVLLRGVNDDAETLAVLSETLFASGTLPYYLHLLDRVAGAQHFEVPEDEARRLMDSLSRRLPGYLVPRLVKEIEGYPSKQIVPPASR